MGAGMSLGAGTAELTTGSNNLLWKTKTGGNLKKQSVLSLSGGNW